MNRYFYFNSVLPVEGDKPIPGSLAVSFSAVEFVGPVSRRYFHIEGSGAKNVWSFEVHLRSGISVICCYDEDADKGGPEVEQRARRFREALVGAWNTYMALGAPSLFPT